MNDARTSVRAFLLTGGLEDASRNGGTLCIGRTENRAVKGALFSIVALFPGIEGAILTDLILADIVTAISTLRATLAEIELRADAGICRTIPPWISVTLFPVITLLLCLFHTVTTGGTCPTSISTGIKVAAFS